MKNLRRIRDILKMASEFESRGTDDKLAEGVKKTTKMLLKKNPDTTFEDILMNLLMSAKESYRHMIDSEDINSSTDMFMNLVEMNMKDEDDKMSADEEFMLRYILKSQLVKNMLQKSFDVSVKAVTEVWSDWKAK